MYRLATMHRVTDRQRDRQHYDANNRSYCVQYDRLKIGPHVQTYPKLL